ncbi:hypothetical protein B0H21DRAFT_838109 [Amylocystis lapponica]|nr:hypothetical protein B0H21DRAFT_838109 [Amylocystis lapponica]
MPTCHPVDHRNDVTDPGGSNGYDNGKADPGLSKASWVVESVWRRGEDIGMCPTAAALCPCSFQSPSLSMTTSRTGMSSRLLPFPPPPRAPAKSTCSRTAPRWKLSTAPYVRRPAPSTCAGLCVSKKYAPRSSRIFRSFLSHMLRRATSMLILAECAVEQVRSGAYTSSSVRPTAIQCRPTVPGQERFAAQADVRNPKQLKYAVVKTIKKLTLPAEVRCQLDMYSIHGTCGQGRPTRVRSNVIAPVPTGELDTEGSNRLLPKRPGEADSGSLAHTVNAASFMGGRIFVDGGHEHMCGFLLPYPDALLDPASVRHLIKPRL